MFAECYKHYPSRSRQTGLATAATNMTKPVTKILGPVDSAHRPRGRVNNILTLGGDLVSPFHYIILALIHGVFKDAEMMIGFSRTLARNLGASR